MEESAEAIWDKAQEQLRTMLKKDLYELWFAPIKAGSLKDESITLQVSNAFCEVWLTDNYLSLIKDVLSYVASTKLEVVFEVVAAEETPAEPSSVAEPERDIFPTSRFTETQPPRRVVASPERRAVESPRFNPNNTFDTFVVGDTNRFAHAAAVAVAQSPGMAYNPLYLYSGVGLGKTHLLHAIGQYVVESNKRARVAYLSSEQFTNEYIEALQNKDLGRFRRKYRETDVLLIDDVQFLAGKERIQEEFFHTFNALHGAHKQIVMTCDRPSQEIQNLENRLVSRFEWGMVADLQIPDVETRMAILRNKAQTLSVEVPEEIISFLANRVRANIRRLEGAFTRVASYASLMPGSKLTVEKVEKLLRDVLQEEGRYTISIDAIQKKVAEHFDIRFADMTSRRRPENIAFPRQIAMFLARQMTEHSLNSIGQAFGGRDHGTVMHACKLVKDRMEQDSTIRQKVLYLENQLHP